MDVKEDISNEKIYNSIEEIQRAIESLKISGQKHYMRSRYRQACAFTLSITFFALGLLVASIGEGPLIAIASGLLIGGIVSFLASLLLLIQAQKDDYVPPHKV